MKQNKELIHYLNSEVQTNKGKLVGIKRGYSIIEDSKFLNGVEYCDIDLQYYLYPLSCLTETINHEGKDEIPLVELAKIEGCLNKEMTFKVDGNILHIFNINKQLIYQFGYLENYFELWDYEEGRYVIVNNQLSLFQYLFSRRINPFPELEAKDPRELGYKNPYLIIKK